MIKVGIISDTHGTYDAKLQSFLSNCDIILHAGDIGNIATADAIAAHKKLLAVHGNIDDHTVRLTYPESLLTDIGGVKILMTHIGGYPRSYTAQAERLIRQHKPQLFISGHSHILKVMNDHDYKLLHINPGGAGCSGFHRVRTAVRLTIKNGTFTDLEVGEWQR